MDIFFYFLILGNKFQWLNYTIFYRKDIKYRLVSRVSLKPVNFMIRFMPRGISVTLMNFFCLSGISLKQIHKSKSNLFCQLVVNNCSKGTWNGADLPRVWINTVDLLLCRHLLIRPFNLAWVQFYSKLNYYLNLPILFIYSISIF